MELEIGAVFERYTIEAVLGSGGFAVVYRVRHNTLDSLHALKVLELSSAAIRRRMLAEGRAQAKLSHPNVVSVTDVIEVEGQPGLIMEYIDGMPLSKLVKRRQFTVEEVDRIGVGIVRGVAAAHRHGLIHRDLKPANILLAEIDGDWVPKILDFGLVKAMDQKPIEGELRTQSGVAMGTPNYMSPEQIRDAASVDARTDIFALGAILYELSSGKRAFPGKDPFVVFSMITQGRFAPLRELAPELPDRIYRAVGGALQTAPESRIPNCEELLAVWRGVESSSSPSWGSEADRSATSLETLPEVHPTLSPSSGPSAQSLPEVDSAPSKRRSPALFAIGILGSIAIAALMVVWAPWKIAPQETQPVTTAEPVPLPDPLPSDPEPQPTVEQPITEVPKPVVQRPKPIIPSPLTVEPDPEPVEVVIPVPIVEKPKPIPPLVTVDGKDVGEVRFYQGNDAFSLKELKPGSYTVTVFLGGIPKPLPGSVELVSGKTVKIRCGMGTCTW